MTDELKNKLTERFEFLAKRSEEQVSADIYDALLKAYLAGGEYGYQYAQEHPAWVSVKKELPEPNIYKEGKTFPSVLVCLADGYIDTDAYDTDDKEWCVFEGEVESWMPLPTPPVKKGVNDEAAK